MDDKKRKQAEFRDRQGKRNRFSDQGGAQSHGGQDGCKWQKKSGGVLVPTLLLELFTSWATGVIMVMTISRHRVSNLRQAEVS